VRAAIDQTVVITQDFSQLVVRNRVRTPIVGAGHGFGRDQRIIDGFFRGLNRCQEKSIDPPTLQALRGGNGWLSACRAVACIRAAVRGREGQKNVPGAIGFYCACATEAKTHAFCYTLQLIRLERSVRGDHDNDRTLLLLLGRKNASRGLRTTSRSWLAV